MPIFDRLQHGADLAKFKANQLLHINRIQGEISGIKRDILMVREKVVITVLTLHHSGVLTIPELEALCMTIDNYKGEIDEKEALVESIRAESLDGVTSPVHQSSPANPCPECNYDVPLGAIFCSNCGAGILTVSTVSASTGDNSNKCSVCGSSMPSDSDFCPNCGKSVNLLE